MSIAQNFPNLKPSLLLDFSNTEALDSRVTFARASTARFYDGRTVAKAEENLLLRSQEFDNAAWLKNNVTVTANATTAPDGTSTAEKLNEDDATSAHVINQLLTLLAAPYTSSVYLKASERSFALFSLSTVTGVSVNLTTGAVTSAVGSPANITSTDAGNGWWRVSFTFTPSAGNTNLNIYSSTDGVWANRSFAGTVGSGIFLWGAQLEQRSSVTAYTPTTTQPITNYIPVLQTAAAGVARFDHNPITGESLGLLIEEQRTNLFLRSEEFDDAGWTKGTGNPTISSNVVVAPDGSLSADKFVEGTANGSQGIGQTVTAPTSAISYSVFAKKGERYKILLREATTTGWSGLFDINSGTVLDTEGGSSVSTQITAVGNGWYKCVINFASTAGSSRLFRIVVAPDNATTVATANSPRTGDGFSGIYIWGAQLEAGAFPTSYIPTVASQVTRSADAASMTGANFSSWFRADEGSFYIDGNIQTTGINNYLIARDNATANNRLQLYIQNNTAFFQIRSGGSTEAVISRSPSNKNAAGYELNNSAFVVNGQIATDTVCVMPSALAEMIIGSNGNIKKLAFYPKRLANAELQALTQN